MPEEKDIFKEFGGKQSPKGEDLFSEFGGKPIEGEKKKSEQSSSSPSPSELGGSTSELVPGTSALPEGQIDGPYGTIGAPRSQTPSLQQAAQPDLLRAATSSGEVTPKSDIFFDPNIAQKQQELHPYKEAFARGMAQAGNYVMKSIPGTYDMIAMAGNAALKATSGGRHRIPYFNEIGDDESIFKSAVSGMDQAIERSQQERQKTTEGKTITDYFSGDKPDYSKGFSELGQNLLEMIPTSVGLAFAMAKNPTMANTMGGAAFIEDAKTKLDEKPELADMSPDEKMMWAAVMGGTEMASENLGISRLGPMFKNILEKSGKEAMEKAGKEMFQESVGKVLKRYMGVQAEEVGSELLNNTLQNIYANASGLDPDRKPFDNFSETFINSLALSTVLSGPTAALDVVKTKKAVKQAAELADQKKALTEDLQNPDVSDDVKESLSKKIQDINEQEADLASEEKKKFEELTPEGKEQVNTLLDQQNRIANTITDENVSKETREVFKKDLESIDKEIDKVYETSKIKPEEAQVDDSAEDTQAEIDYLNEVKNAFGLSEQEQARYNELVPPQPATVEVSQVEAPVEQITEEVTQPQAPVTQQEAPVEQVEPPTPSAPEIPEVQETPASQTINQQKNEQEQAEEAIAPKEADVLAPEQKQPEAQANLQETPPAETAVQETKSIPQKDADNSIVLKKMNDDIEAMKQMKTEDLAEKKFIGMIERAWKAKEEGKISRPTYTEFKNRAKDILEGKLKAKGSVDATEAKLRSSAAMNKVREKLLSQGYDKVFKKSDFKSTDEDGGLLTKVRKISSINNKSSEEVLNFIKSEIEDKSIIPVIDAMLSNVSKIDFVKYKGTDTVTLPGVSYYGLVNGNIGLSKASVILESYQNTLQTIAHEYIHAFTIQALKLKKELMSDSEIKFKESIEDIYKKLKDMSDDKLQYGFTDPSEFVSEIMTNPEFVKTIKNTPKTKTIWNQIVNAIKRLLGIKSKSTGAENKEASALVDQAISNILSFIPESTPSKLDISDIAGKKVGSEKLTGLKAVDDLILTLSDLIHRGIDAGLTESEARKKALEVIKKHPLYKKEIGKTIDENEFDKAVREASKDQKVAKKKDQPQKEGDIYGSRKKKKTVARQEESKFKDYVSEMDEDEKFYQSINVSKAKKQIDKMLNEFEQDDLLEELANDMIEGNSPFHPKITPLAAFTLADKMRSIAEKEGNEMQKDATNKLAGKLMASRNNVINVAATQTALEAEVAKLLPLSEEGLLEYAKASVSNVQDIYMNDKQKQDIETAAESISDIMETEEAKKAIKDKAMEEIARIGESLKSKEWVSESMSKIDSLKIDLKDC